MNTTPYITPRVEAMLLRVAIAMSTAFTLFIGGCAMPHNESLALVDGPHTYSGGRAASGSDTLFDNPEANAVYAMYGGREAFGEYARLDSRMNIAGGGSPRLATAEWPQDPAPDATNIYYTYLPVSTSTSSQLVPVYRRERPYWRGWRY